MMKSTLIRYENAVQEKRNAIQVSIVLAVTLTLNKLKSSLEAHLLKKKFEYLGQTQHRILEKLQGLFCILYLSFASTPNINSA